MAGNSAGVHPWKLEYQILEQHASFFLLQIEGISEYALMFPDLGNRIMVKSRRKQELKMVE